MTIRLWSRCVVLKQTAQREGDYVWLLMWVGGRMLMDEILGGVGLVAEIVEKKCGGALGMETPPITQR